ncbi:hypothetical protein ACA910_020219 [Epithemia clementina (nom. ined.)]
MNDTNQNPPIYAWPDIFVIDNAAAALDEKENSKNTDSNPALVLLATAAALDNAAPAAKHMCALMAAKQQKQ